MKRFLSPFAAVLVGATAFAGGYNLHHFQPNVGRDCTAVTHGSPFAYSVTDQQVCAAWSAAQPPQPVMQP